VFPQIFGKYVLEREIASGGMAVVYLATLRGAGGFEKRLVVKQIRAELASDDAFLRRFVTEAKTTVELSHPNIVPVYELGVEQGVYFIAMEFAEGATLAELLRASGPLTPEEGAYLGVEILRALDYAHRKAAIVHRDVTPRNVLIDEEGAVRLIDFGIAAPVSGEGVRNERVFGSPGHMPPEQRDGGRLTPATDVFAVGALLLEAWTGDAPFRRATTEESDSAVRKPPPAPSLSQAGLAPLDDLVAKSVAVDALDRPQTAEDFARPLRDFLRSADLGDIARRLGERVRRVRRADPSKRDRRTGKTSDRPPSGPVTPIMRTPATPSTRRLDPVTETFATREEVVEWTQRGSAFPKAVETPAADSRANAGRTNVRLRVGALLAGAALVTAVVAMTVKRPAPADKPETTRPVSTAPLVPVASVPGSSSVVTEPPAPPSATTESPPAAAALSSAERVVVGAADGATFSLTSDLPGTKVTFDGAPVGYAPIAVLKRPAGKHTVMFVSAELGEQLTTSIDAKAGESLKIRAQFKKPDPSIAVRR
jgi:eukaryotic-like serine/threonine-protein kinase